MAQLVETIATVKVSRLIKDGEPFGFEGDAEIFAQLEQIIEELLGDSRAMVEIDVKHD